MATKPNAATRFSYGMTLVLLLGAFTVNAEPMNTGMEITPLIGYRSGGNFTDPNSGEDLDLDEGGSYGLLLNIDHDANTQWEFLYSHQDSELQLAQLFVGERVFDLDIDYFSFGGTYVWRDPRVEPFISAGIGVTHMSPEDDRLDSETRAMLQLGGGYKFFLTKNIGLRLEVRGYATALSSDSEIFCGNGACIARVDSSGFSQYEINAGLNARF
ncbi:MAG: outer membrane beta-barrel protein [Gammaproteobacteria bacterium]|nr:outer membrane beta-barrel protein [Gammaproteobacteria bacterium]